MPVFLAASGPVVLLVVAATLAVGWLTYAGAGLVPASRTRRLLLVGLRTLALLILVLSLMRPAWVLPPTEAGQTIVPILLDVSRSMQLTGAGGYPRIEQARRVVDQLQGALAPRFVPEVWTFGRALARAGRRETLNADADATDLSTALRTLQQQYRGRSLAAVVVVSDGADTSGREVSTDADVTGVPVHTIGVGARGGEADVEVLDVAAGDAALPEASVDLTVAAVRHGSVAPLEIRVLENGRPFEVRNVTPEASGVPVREVFTVAAASDVATVYTVEIPPEQGELTEANNRRSVLVQPYGRRRRILMIEGAPGFEHTFFKRALQLDTGIELDSVVRKGRDGEGHATYLVQAADERADRLALGFPDTRAALYQYDSVVLANIDPDAFSRAQLEMLAAFVAERGGGLLVLGARSFAAPGLEGTPLAEVLPVEGAVERRAFAPTAGHEERQAVVVTAVGRVHPAMRIGATPEQVARRWAEVPPLAAVVPLGSPRPGAQVLAVVQGDDGVRPLVAVQRFGQGRSLVFAGEGVWRWRMRRPASDRTYELFWRHVARWLSSGSPDPVTVSVPAGARPGESVTMYVDVRGEEFTPVADAEVDLRVALPGDESRELPVVADHESGRYAAGLTLQDPGVYRVRVNARDGATLLGSVERWMLVGGTDREMSDPRFNSDLLARVATTSGGTYRSAGDAVALASLLSSRAPELATPRVRELWHSVWVFLALVALLTTEWSLRRRWGLR